MLRLVIQLLTVQFCRSDAVKTDAEIGDPSVNSPFLLERCSENRDAEIGDSSSIKTSSIEAV